MCNVYKYIFKWVLTKQARDYLINHLATEKSQRANELYFAFIVLMVAQYQYLKVLYKRLILQIYLQKSYQTACYTRKSWLF